MKLFLRFCGFLFAAGTIVFLVGIGAAAGLLWHFSKDLPDYSQLQDYEPPVMTRVHAGDGSLMAEYATQRRLYIPIQAVPKMVINAFLAAEDKNFYDHNGLDYQGIIRAGTAYVQNLGSNRRPQGASTITQQVAKNFLLTNEVSFTRKIKEALLALKIERTYSKDKILELYLNEIYLGFGAYGVAAASLMYFDKSVHELTVPEAAYLAALPKAPSVLHPFRARERAIERRNYVIDQMVITGVVNPTDAERFKKEPLTVTARPTGAHIFAADYFAEEVRRWIYEKYGEKTLYEGGLSVRTTLDPKLQVLARQALVDGLVKFDEQQGYRGPVVKLKPEGDWGLKLSEVKQLNDVAPWRLSVVLAVTDQAATVGLYPPREPGGGVSKERATGVVPLEAVKWAKPAEGPRKGRVPQRVTEVLEVGDVVYVEPLNKENNTWRLRQVPEVSGAIVAMDPYTGRVLAMVGGFSFDQSQFNRATQAMRQPGSSFKPFVYAAALDNGYTPATVVMDAPIEIDQGPGVPPWRPENYSTGKYYGPSTLRTGIELSRNTMTVRLAQDVGMPLISEYARRFGVYDNLPTFLSYSLGAGETTVLRMVTAYSMFDNGGKRIVPTFIDRIQDRYGRTVYKHDSLECRGCDAKEWANQPEPTLVDKREQVIDPMTAYQITSMMEGVVQRGTATVLKQVGKPIAGKTGTTNDEKDVWFVGFSPNLAVGVYLGYDKPRQLGHRATGGGVAAPIVGAFLKEALKDKPPIPFRVPAGIKLIRIDARTGMRLPPGAEGGRAVLEAFKPGTGPPDTYSVIGHTADAGHQPSYQPQQQQQPGGFFSGFGAPSGDPGYVQPQQNRQIRSGTGGLY